MNQLRRSVAVEIAVAAEARERHQRRGEMSQLFHTVSTVSLSGLSQIKPHRRSKPRTIRGLVAAMKIRDALARGLRLVRTERGMTQAELAERADLHVQFVSQLERRQRGVTLENIDALAEALGSTGPELIAIGAGKTQPRRTTLDHRLQEVVDAWPRSEQDALIKVLAALGSVAGRKRPKRP